MGSAWSIIAGTFGSLSGGYLPYSSGAFGRAVIDAGLSNCEVRYRARVMGSYYDHSGLLLRSNAAASDKFTFSLSNYNSSNRYLAWSVATGIIHNPANQPSGTRYNLAGLTSGQYYTFRFLFYNDIARCWLDDTGQLLLACAGVAKTGNTFWGLYAEQPQGNWDFIEVKPIHRRMQSISVMGDSISNDDAEWPGIYAARHNNGYCLVKNHAAAGSTIQDFMHSQALSCIADAADYALVLLGTNDSHGYNPTAEYQENLQELWAALHKPIYCLGILPTTTWTDGDRNTFNSRLQAAVDNAVSGGANAIYWSTDGWIDPAADTSDGLHLNTLGQIKIADQIEARL
jgi:lysophospholipase L1-like esterase